MQVKSFFVYLSFFSIVVFPCLADVIVTEKTEIKPVIVTKETFDHTYYCYIMEGSAMPEQKIETRKIVRIEREKIPIDYQTAESFMEIKLYAKAIESYKRCTTLKDWTPQHAYYKIGVCYQNLRKNAEAIQTYQQLLKTFPETVYKAEIHWELGMAYLNSKKFSEAQTMFDNAKKFYLKKDPTSTRILESQYYQAFAVEKAGKYTAAITLYTDMMKKNISNVNISNQIKMSLANCYAQSKQVNQAKQILGDLLKSVETDQKNLLANIYIQYARFYFAENKMQEALLCYLRIIMMYPEIPEITQESYKGAIYCMDLLKKDQPEYSVRIAQLKSMQQKLKK